MPVYTWEEWAPNQMEISQRLRGLADQWDKGLMEADQGLLRDTLQSITDLEWDMDDAVDDMPRTPADQASAQVDLNERDV